MNAYERQLDGLGDDLMSLAHTVMEFTARYTDENGRLVHVNTIKPVSDLENSRDLRVDEINSLINHVVAMNGRIAPYLS